MGKTFTVELRPLSDPGDHALFECRTADDKYVPFVSLQMPRWVAERLQSEHRALASMPDPAKGVEALRNACQAIAGIPGTIDQSEWDRRVANAIRLAKQALAACGEAVGGG